MLPRDIACPHCEAPVDRGCRTATGYATATHAKRWAAIGVRKPSVDDRHRDYLDGVERNSKIKAGVFASIRATPCEYCGPGIRTGLPGNACENCMNTGLKYPQWR